MGIRVYIELIHFIVQQKLTKKKFVSVSRILNGGDSGGSMWAVGIA